MERTLRVLPDRQRFGSLTGGGQLATAGEQFFDQQGKVTSCLALGHVGSPLAAALPLGG